MAPHVGNEEVIFEAARQITGPTERRAYLEDACGDDVELRTRIEALLYSHEEAGQFLEPSDAPPITKNLDDSIGTRIDRYQLKELIGEGGFGDVWLAEQQEPVRRQVALKIIKLGMDTKQVVARFEAERQALALMEHANIAKIHDAGATEAGRPYFVMELVRGIPITEHCDQHQLSIPERLELFMKVCGAVQHAHQKGIIHRDLKPTNILVTLHDGQPVPKVIDFGIAKAIQQRLTEQTVYTAFHQFIGTPEYMSPEQAEHADQDIDTRSDIYSLGVLLYELLVGTTPFDREQLKSHGYSEICRVIRESDPSTPSRRLSGLGDTLGDVVRHRQTAPAELGKQLRGDLDWIVMKALEKDRTRRYENASALSLDIERHLKDEPVLARPPSAAYRLQKFGRKHRGPMVAVSSVVAALLCGLVATTTLYVRARVATEQKQQMLYVSDISSAYDAWDSANLTRVKQLLSRHIPAPGEPDLRGFEWHYLWLQQQELMAAPLLDHGASIACLALSPDGSLLATGGEDHLVRLWDIRARPATFVGELTGAADGVTCLDFSPDGEQLAAGSWDHSVTVWDVHDRSQLRRFDAYDRPVFALRYSSDGRSIATGPQHNVRRSGPPEIRIWDAESGQLLAQLPGHTDDVTCLAFSADGGTLVSGSWDQTTKVWDIESGTCKTTLDSRYRVDAVAFSPDEATLASCHGSGVTLWDTSTWSEQTLLREVNHGARKIAFSAEGQILASGGKDRTVRIWDLAGARLRHTFVGHTDDVSGVVFGAAERTLLTASRDGTVREWNLAMLQDELPRVAGARQCRLAISPSGKKLARGTGWLGNVMAASEENVPILLNIETGEQASLGNTSSTVHGIGFSPDGSLLVTAGQHVEGGKEDGDAQIDVWDVTSCQRVGQPLFYPKEARISSLAFAPDGRSFCTGGFGLPIVFWNVGDHEPRVTIADKLDFAESAGAIGISFSPDGKLLAAGGARWIAGRRQSPWLRLWNTASRELVADLPGHTALVISVAFSPDGRTLASTSYDDTVRLWDVKSGRLSHTITGHADWVFSAGFSPEGKTLVTGGVDGVRLWHAASGDAFAFFDLPYTQSVRFTPDGTTLIGCNASRNVLLWHASSKKQSWPTYFPGDIQMSAAQP